MEEISGFCLFIFVFLVFGGNASVVRRLGAAGVVSVGQFAVGTPSKGCGDYWEEWDPRSSTDDLRVLGRGLATDTMVMGAWSDRWLKDKGGGNPVSSSAGGFGSSYAWDYDATGTGLKNVRFWCEARGLGSDGDGRAVVSACWDFDGSLLFVSDGYRSLAVSSIIGHRAASDGAAVQIASTRIRIWDPGGLGK